MNRPKEELEGEVAYHAGKPHESNPYPRLTVAHESWFMGWAKAADADPASDR